MSDDERREEDLVVTLTKPFKYDRKGEQYNASFITLTAPTSRHMKECAGLTQAFYRASRESAERVRNAPSVEAMAEAADAEMTAIDVVQGISACACVELSDVFDIARRLFLSGVALVEGEVKLTSHLADLIGMPDWQQMVGGYIINFATASTPEPTRRQSCEGSQI